MSDYIADLSKYRLEKARSDLLSAKVLLDNNLITQSINRSYYAVFHAARALLAYDIFDSKKHTGIISFFNKRYIKTGEIDHEYFKILIGAERIRHNSDYDDFFEPETDQALIQYENAFKFIEMIAAFIERKNK